VDGVPGQIVANWVEGKLGSRPINLLEAVRPA
jgi:hypothetical protein